MKTSILLIIIVFLQKLSFSQSSSICQYITTNLYKTKSTQIENLNDCVSNFQSKIANGLRALSTNMAKVTGTTPYKQLDNYDDPYYDIIIEALYDFGLSPNFFYENCNSIENAYATNLKNTENGIDRIIVSDRHFLNSIRNEFSSEYPSLSIIFHEIGHHLNNHTYENDKLSAHEKEIQADEFSGFMICQLGGSLQNSLESIQKYAPINATVSHPDLITRKTAISKGWMKCNKKMIDYNNLDLQKLFELLEDKTISTTESIRISESIKSKYNSSFAWEIKASYCTYAKLYAEANKNLYYVLNNYQKKSWTVDFQQIRIKIGDNYSYMGRYLESCNMYKNVLDHVSNYISEEKVLAVIKSAEILYFLNIINIIELENIVKNNINDVANQFEKKRTLEKLKNNFLDEENKTARIKNILSKNDFENILSTQFLTIEDYYACTNYLLYLDLKGDHEEVISSIKTFLPRVKVDFYINKLIGEQINSLYILGRYAEATKLNKEFPENNAKEYFKESLVKKNYFSKFRDYVIKNSSK